jgi:hypothetical protein
LEHPALPVAHKSQIAKVIKCLKALIEVVPEIEERANKIIFSLRNGSFDESMELHWPDLVCGGTMPSDSLDDLDLDLPASRLAQDTGLIPV